MWKKDEVQKAGTEPERSSRQERPSPPATPGERATIGRSITIRGEVTGDEDLVIQGRVEGSVDLQQHSVTVGPEGEVTANIRGRIVTVEGHVEGDLRADERVILRDSARVEGDISAPRVTLEDGAYFRGGVDMGETGEADERSSTASGAGKTGGPAGRAELRRSKGPATSGTPSEGESTPGASAGPASDRGVEPTSRTG